MQGHPATLREPATIRPPIYSGTSASSSNSEELPHYDDQTSPPDYDLSLRFVSHNSRAHRGRRSADVLDAQTDLRAQRACSALRQGLGSHVHVYGTSVLEPGDDNVALEGNGNSQTYTFGFSADSRSGVEQQGAAAAPPPPPRTMRSVGRMADSTTVTDGRGNSPWYARLWVTRAVHPSIGLNELLVMGWTPELAKELSQLLNKGKTTIKELERMVSLQRLSQETLDEALRVSEHMILRRLQEAGMLP